MVTTKGKKLGRVLPKLFCPQNPTLKERLVGPVTQGINRLWEIGLDALILCFSAFY